MTFGEVEGHLLQRSKPVSRVLLYLCVLKVMPPQGTDFVLAANVPYSKTDVLVLHRLHIKTCQKRTIKLFNPTPVQSSLTP